eukprot:CAMPEP_0170439762 /NCGR_PEP_ID=MMETSP0117_2-20130122/45962_1 /TAXON_ID=400756 /ORGANISM="Durinskia baltica, Strain CSIRO CS-38" /LENGTH=1526 /DNA_ID=CAMNT_0010700115 /DNA_START=162 /DNA_END=4743 /DNA_ORIENTATION=+
MGQRVANVYDLSEKCYLLKFAIPGKSAKITLLLESGIRFHTTKYSRDLPELPSAFAMKLRKFIRTKRLEDVRQIGIDRVVDFKFGSGDAVNHLILELYANGNIVLTDGNYEVIALLRSHQFEDDVTLKVGEVYPIAYTTNVSTQSGSLNKANIDVNELAEDMNNLQMGNIDNIENTATHSNSSGVLAMTVDEFKNWAAAKLIEFKEFHAHEELVHAAAAEAKERELAMQPIEEPTKANMTEKAQKKAAKKLLAAQMAQAAGQLLLSKGSGVAACGPEVLDHCLLQARIKPSSRVDTISDMPGEDVERMLSELSDANRITERLNTPGLPGFIVYKNIAPCKATPSDQTTTSTHSGNGDFSAVAGNKEGGTREVNTHTQDSLEFIEFLPMLFEQHSGRQVLTYPSFDEAVDEYYSKIEGQRLAREAQAAEIAAEKKIEKIKRDQEKMRKSLITQQERMQRGASLLETYAEEVDKVALVINSALGAGMAWEDIGEMVKAETAAGNPIASLISRLDLQRNRLWVKLRDNTSVTSSSSTPASLLADPLSNYNNNEDFSEELVEGGFVKVTSASVPHNMSMSGGAMKNEENKDAELDMFSSDSEDEVKSAKSTPVALEEEENKDAELNMFSSDSEVEVKSAKSTPVALANTAANTAATATETGSPATVAAGVKSDASHTHPKSIAKDTATTSSTTKTPMPAVRGPTTVEVELDLSLSAYANARKMYSQKKIAYAKEAKTVEASSKVLQQVGERVLQGVESQKLKKNLKAVRKVHWFEKFNWCISSEGYLILSGRDAQQNEILFKRYMRPSDIYVHADIPGAATCIVRAKNPSMLSAATGSAGVGNSSSSGGHSGATSASGRPPAAASAAPNRPISPMAIQEAGMMAVSRSNAWKGKIGGVAAWWVWANQVSKTAPSGEYLTTGSFMILGKKNFLPPMALEMGFGVMFRLDDASVPRHMKDWKDRSYLNDEKSMTVFTDNLDRYAVNFQELGPNALCLGDSGDENEDDLQQRQYHNDENSDGAVVHDCPALRLNDESIAPLHSSKESSDAHALLTSTSPLSSMAVLGKKELRKAARAEKMKKAEEEKGKGKKKEKKDKDSGNKGPSVEEADQENQIEDEEEEEEEDEEPEEPEEPEQDPPKVTLDVDEKTLVHRPVTTPDLAPLVMSANFAQFSLPEESEGFDHIRYDWSKGAKADEYLKQWKISRKTNSRVEELRPSAWFHQRVQQWQQATQEWRQKVSEWKTQSQKKMKLRETKKSQRLQAMARLESQAKASAAKPMDKRTEKDAEMDKKREEEKAELEKQAAEAEAAEEQEKDAEEEAEKAFLELDIFGADDVNDVAGGIPLYRDFQSEDWTLMQLVFELNLLVHAFTHDVADPERPGVHVDHLGFYFKKYFNKELRPKDYGVESVKELCEIVDDKVLYFTADDVLASQLDGEFETPAVLPKKVIEAARRYRRLRIDLGEKGAALKLSASAGQGGSRGAAGGGGGGGGGHQGWQNRSGGYGPAAPQKFGKGSHPYGGKTGGGKGWAGGKR